MAVATLTMIFALAGRLFKKHELVQTGRWNERANYMGQGLTSRTLGLVGAGGIGQEILRLARPFFARMIVADPYADLATVAELGASDGAARRGDAGGRFRRRMLPAQRGDAASDRCAKLALMKPTAYYLNMGRGPIHDEKALAEVLKAGRIAGAGLDVTEREPIEPDSRLLGMENVIITPHALCWTDECFREIAATAACSPSSMSRSAGGRRTW